MPLDKTYHDDRSLKYYNFRRIDEFINRNIELTKLRNYYFVKRFRLICLYGEGGIGKTSLARKFLSEVIDQNNCELHSIVWTTAKKNELKISKNYIYAKPRIKYNKIENSESAFVSNLTEFFETILTVSGHPEFINKSFFRKSVGTKQKVLDWLKIRNILIVIDDLDSWDNWYDILEFADMIPYPSSLIITSRRNLFGSIQGLSQVKLSPLSQEDISKVALRNAKRRSWSLTNKSKSRIVDFSQGNPLVAELMVGALAYRKSENVLSNYNDILQFFSSSTKIKEYLFSDLFDNLSRIAQDTLVAIVATKEVEAVPDNSLLSKLTNSSIIDLEFALQELEETSFINRNTKDNDKLDMHNLIIQFIKNAKKEEYQNHLLILKK